MRIISIVVFLFSVSGCSIRPLPEDVTGYSTYEIVKHIRCEAREAIIGHATQYLKKYDKDLALRIERGDAALQNVQRERLPPEAQAVFNKYDQSAIAYDFVFDITEVNDANADFDIGEMLTRGPLTLGFKVGKKLERQNTRNFRISDTFRGLVYDVPVEYCAYTNTDENIIYPITGQIGLIELVNTFLNLNQSGNLSAGKGDKVPTIADTIEFTTKISGTVNPRVELKPVADRGFQLAKLGLKLDGSREDVHKVTVAISLPQDQTRKLRQRQPAAKTSAEVKALDELDRQEERAFRSNIKRLEENLDETSE